MKKPRPCLLFLPVAAMLGLLLAACSGSHGGGSHAVAAQAEPPATPATSTSVPDTVESWSQLAPEDDIFQRPPPKIGSGWGGGNAASLEALPTDGGPATVNGMPIDHSGNQHAEQFGSSEVVKGLEGKSFALDGYVVPLESDDKGRVTELLFVPFYGACIHVPPPPPNQILHVVLGKPIDVPELWDPFHLEGRLHIARFEADIANATYDAVDASIAPVSG